MEFIKEFNMERHLIRALYAFIAMELFLKDELKSIGSRGQVTKEEAFKLHSEHCGQSLQNHELDAMFEDACQDGSSTVDFETFLKSHKTQRKIFMIKQLTKAFMLLVEDAEGMVGKIKKALRFA